MVSNISTLERSIYKTNHADLVLQLEVIILSVNMKGPSSMVKSMALVCHSTCSMGPYLHLFYSDVDR